MTTKYAELPLASIRKHPKNPRHKATADPELVDSIKAHGVLEPALVAPALDAPGMYDLIAGHRRADGCKKAKLKTIPTIIREDLNTEQAQIEAMLIENGRRVDLTPIEEAEGYHQLELFGYKAQAIATAVGRDIKTVRGRLKLLKLSASTKTKVHAGQLHLEDAVAIGEFSDDPDATKRLEKAAKDGNLKYRLQRERSHRDALRKNATRVAKLLQAGATEIEVTNRNGGYLYDSDLPDNTERLSRTPSTDWGQHKGCLAFTQTTGNDWSLPEVIELCSNASSHHAQLDETERARREAREKAEAETTARAEAEDAARKVRIATVMGHVGTDLRPPPELVDVLSSLLPALVRSLDSTALAAYFDAADVPEADRWSDYAFNYSGDDKTRQKAETLFEQHAAEIQNASVGTLVRHLTATLVALAEEETSQLGYFRAAPALVADYLQLLEHAGHEFCDVDKEIRASLDDTGDDAEPEAS